MATREPLIEGIHCQIKCEGTTILVKSTEVASLAVMRATCNGIRAIASDSLSKRSQ